MLPDLPLPALPGPPPKPDKKAPPPKKHDPPAPPDPAALLKALLGALHL